MGRSVGDGRSWEPANVTMAPKRQTLLGNAHRTGRISRMRREYFTEALDKIPAEAELSFSRAGCYRVRLVRAARLRPAGRVLRHTVAGLLELMCGQPLPPRALLVAPDFGQAFKDQLQRLRQDKAC